jgi:spore coat polysaccharide biosynthesis protein SpsF
MGSTRLPGKALADICGKTMLVRVIERTARARLIDEVAVATSTAPADAAIVEACEALGVRSFRGDEDDVLSRYRDAARAFEADVVVRITSDCPLIDPEVVDLVAAALEREPGADFAANTLVRTFPQGLDVEVAPRATLERAAAEATLPHHRAHVFPYVYGHPELFRLVGVEDGVDHSSLRWTVDTAEDLALVRALYERGDGLMGRARVLELLEAEPSLSAINAGVRQKRAEEG